MDPSRLQIQTSAATASKYRARFSSISGVEFEGEIISTQISGARSKRLISPIFSGR